MTIRHMVLFTLRPDVDREDPRVLAAADLSRSHAEHIPEIDQWWAGFDIGRRQISADFAVVGTFADLDAVTRYLNHPHHRRGAAAWGALASWTVIDVDEGPNGEVVSGARNS